MIYLAALVATACFVAALRLMDILPIAAGAVETTRAAAQALKDAGIGDADKERLLQKASLKLMGTFVSIAARAALAVAVSLLPLLAFQAAGLVHLTAVAHLLATWQGIALTSAVMTAGYFVKLRQ